jgi:hypothetical protein
MVVDPEGTFLTLRTHPGLAQVTVIQEGEGLRVATERHGECQIPYVGSNAPRRRVEVWGDGVEARDAGEPAAAWFGAVLGIPCRLVYMPDTSIRPVDPAYGAAGDQVSFADGYPLLLASMASLAALNGRLERPVPMSRFRPNIVIEGADAFAEDGWKGIRIGEVRLRIVKPCARCVAITLDPATGSFDKEPLRTLSHFRRRGNEVLFAQNAIPDSGGWIRMDDLVEPDT